MLYQIIKFVYYDMFNMIRACMQSIDFGGFSLYSFFISVMTVYLVFVIAKRILVWQDGRIGGGGRDD